MKRVLSILLAVVLLVSLVPAGAVESAFTAKALGEEYFTYTVSGGKATITAVDETISGVIDFPLELGGYPVTRVAAGAFKGCDAITGVNITDLAAWCAIDFAEDTYIKWVYTGETIWNWHMYMDPYDENCGPCWWTWGYGGYFYNGCSSNPLAYAEEGLFINDEPVSELVIPAGITKIKSHAFYGLRGVNTVVLPKEVSNVGFQAFRYCSARKLTLGGDPHFDEWYYFDINYLVEQGEFEYCDECRAGENTVSVTTNGRYEVFVDMYNDEYPAYEYGEVQTEYYYQQLSNVSHIAFTEGTQTINKDLSGYAYLTAVTIPASVTTIESGVFAGCDLDAVYYGGSGPDRSNMTIGSNNTALADATWYYNYENVCEHKNTTLIGQVAQTCTETGYTGDTVCDYCGEVVEKGEVIPAHFFGDDTTCDMCGADMYFDYTVANGAVTITGVNDIVDSNVVIPATIGGYPVTAIAANAFYGNTDITAVTIPSTVKTVGENAFLGCTYLRGVYITDLAAWCGIKFANYDANPLGIAGTLYLNGGRVVDLVIPEGVESIGYAAFYGCDSLESVVISEGVKSIGYSAFSECASLTTVMVADSVELIDGAAFYGCGQLNCILLGSGVKTIGTYAFYDCTDLKSITLPNGLTTIGDYAFRSAGITSIVLPHSVTSAGTGAFYACSGLTNAILSSGMSSISRGMFYNCSALKTVTIPKSVTTVTANGFAGCSSLKTVYYEGSSKSNISVGNNNTYLTNASWYYNRCVHTNTTVSGYVAPTCAVVGNTGTTTCDNCSATLITSAVIPAMGHSAVVDPAVAPTCTESGLSVGSHCAVCGTVLKAQEVVPATGHSYGDDTTCDTCGEDKYFVYEVVDGKATITRAKNTVSGALVIPETLGGAPVTAIAANAFENCTTITELTIPVSLQAVGADAFLGCTGLTAVHITDLAAWCDIEFATYTANPVGVARALYLNGEALVDLVIPEGVESVGYAAFYACDTLESVIIPEGVTSIGYSAFSECTSLTKVTIADSVELIDGAAFYECDKLNDIDLGNGVKTIGTYAFYSCVDLTDITLPNGLTAIGDYAFRSAGLTNIVLPHSVTTVGTGAFFNCNALAAATLSKGMDTISRGLFYNGDVLKEITVPKSVTTVTANGFAGCAALATVRYEGTATDRTSIAVGTNNAALSNAAWVYNCCLHANVVLNGYAAPTCMTDGYTGDTVCVDCETTVTAGETLTALGHTYGDDNLCDVCGEDKFLSYYTYKVTNGKAVITDVDTAISGKVVVPITLDGAPVTGLGTEAFYMCSDVTEIVLPNTLTSIGVKAFYECKNLVSVTIPDSVTTISDYAFAVCRSLTEVKLPNKLKTIATRVFRDCSTLAAITIPQSVTSIAGNAFSLCPALIDVYYGGNAIDRAAIKVSAGNDVLDTAVWHYTCTHATATVNGYAAPTCTEDGYTGDTVCLGCDLLIEQGEVIAAAGHTEVADEEQAPTCTENGFVAGTHCDVCGVTLSDATVVPATGHTYTDEADFFCDTCEAVRYITYTVTDGAVAITKMDTIVVGNVVIPDTIEGYPVIAIGNNAFKGCANITELTVPASITKIGDYAFRNCTALATVHYNAVNATHGAAVYLAFNGCTALTTVYIGKEVMQVPANAFRGVTSLKAVYITKNTEVVNVNAFYGCTALADVYYVGRALDYMGLDVKSYNAPLVDAVYSYNVPCFQDHDWTADCDSMCDLCEAKRATTHANIVNDAAVAPTCEASGLTAGSHCADCGNVIEAQRYVPALGHTWDAGEVITAPTTEANGSKLYTCTVCGGTKTVVLTMAEIIDGKYYVNGILRPDAGLVMVEDAYYYVSSGGNVRTGRYMVSNVNEFDFEKGIYYFFEDGKMNVEQGVYEGYYFNENGKLTAYAGLIEWNGTKYYVNDGGKVIVGRYYVSKLNGLLPRPLPYTFYEDGRMLEETRIYDTDGFYYEKGIRTPYAGMVRYEGHWYYVNDGGAYMKNKVQVLTNVNNSGLTRGRRCYFDANGYMVYNTVVNGAFFGADGMAPDYAGVVQDNEGNLYYVSGIHGAVKKNATFNITTAKANGLCVAGRYTADANGVLTPAA